MRQRPDEVMRYRPDQAMRYRSDHVMRYQGESAGSSEALAACATPVRMEFGGSCVYLFGFRDWGLGFWVSAFGFSGHSVWVYGTA